MAVCNLFKKLTKNTGTFLLFSQYNEDLTKMVTQPGSYRVAPSRFIAMDINYGNLTYKNVDLNILVPQILQNNFENGCAYLRSAYEGEFESNWTPEISKNLFWNALLDSGLIHVNALPNNTSHLVEAHYMGEITLQSYDEHAGMGYSEIFCHIPNDATSNYIPVLYHPITRAMGFYKPYLEGYDENDDNIPGWSLEAINPLNGNQLQYIYEAKLEIPAHDANGGELRLGKRDLNSFNINTIIVLYDIYNLKEDGNIDVVYKDIPMGIYFTGLINEDGTVGNDVRKYVNTEELYSTGSSYGLRICSRFSTVANNDEIQTVSIDVSQDSQYSNISLLMSEMAKTYEKLNEMITNTVNYSQSMKEYFSAFKNYRTNVPYIKEIGGINYWFVNGIQLAPVDSLNNDECDCEIATEDDINDIIDDLDVL